MSSSDAAPPADALALTPLEVASSSMPGEDPDATDLPEHPPPPRSALEDAVAAALRRPPCFVSFSGGRDSSAVLAVAAHVARQQGLPLPIPATLVFDAIPEAAEEEWQHLVLSHLSLTEWERVHVDEELDFVGPVATSALARHGLLWPVNVHVHAPLLDLAAGGTLLTGFDGDGLMQGWRWARAAAARRTGLRSPRALTTRAYAASPSPLKYLRERRRARSYPWLSSPARRAVTAASAAHAADEPVRWDERVRWWHRRRYLQMAGTSLDLVAADAGAAVAHPLRDPLFLAGLAATGGRDGLGSRTELMDLLFGDLLPAAVIARRGKAAFGRALWGSRSRSLAQSWDGDGVDPSLVDRDVLRGMWSAEAADTRTAPLLQQVWLSRRQPLEE